MFHIRKTTFLICHVFFSLVIATVSIVKKERKNKKKKASYKSSKHYIRHIISVYSIIMKSTSEDVIRCMAHFHPRKVFSKQKFIVRKDDDVRKNDETFRFSTIKFDRKNDECFAFLFVHINSDLPENDTIESEAKTIFSKCYPPIYDHILHTLKTKPNYFTLPDHITGFYIYSDITKNELNIKVTLGPSKPLYSYTIPLIGKIKASPVLEQIYYHEEEEDIPYRYASDEDYELLQKTLPHAGIAQYVDTVSSTKAEGRFYKNEDEYILDESPLEIPIIVSARTSTKKRRRSNSDYRSRKRKPARSKIAKYSRIGSKTKS